MLPALLKVDDVAAQFNRTAKTVHNYARKHDACAQKTNNLYLPSSPKLGLYSLPINIGSDSRVIRGFDPRDIAEYLENGPREMHGQPLRNWRAKR